MASPCIDHLTTPAELRRGLDAERYAPDRLGRDGFVHGARRDALLEVARALFASAREPVLVLEIDPDCRGAELRGVAVGRRVRREDGFAWPVRMQALEEALG